MFNGGYLMVSKTDTDLYKKLNNALTLGKPVLFYEDATTCYYIDTIAKSGDDIVLTKGGKTITIETDGDITETGDIQVLEDKKPYLVVLRKGADTLSVSLIMYFESEPESFTHDDLVAYLKSIGTSSLTPYLANGYKSTNIATGIYYEEDMGNDRMFICYAGGTGSILATDIIIDVIKL